MKATIREFHPESAHYGNNHWLFKEGTIEHMENSSLDPSWLFVVISFDEYWSSGNQKTVICHCRINIKDPWPNKETSNV
jgi:hypothetical protein